MWNDALADRRRRRFLDVSVHSGIEFPDRRGTRQHIDRSRIGHTIGLHRHSPAFSGLHTADLKAVDADTGT